MERDFNFVAPTQRRAYKSSLAAVWVTTGRVNMGKAVYEGMGSPPRIVFSYDLAAKAIKLEPIRPRGPEGIVARDEADRAGVTLSVPVPLSKQFPAGQFLPIGSGIFVHESEQI